MTVALKGVKFVEEEKVADTKTRGRKKKLSIDPSKESEIADAKKSEQEESGGSGTKKRRRGRPSKKEIEEKKRQEEEAKEQELNELFGGMEDALLEVYTLFLSIGVSAASGKKLLIKEDRKEPLKKSLDLCTRKYIVPYLGENTPLAVLATVTGVVIMDTINEGEEINPDEERESDNSSNGKERIGKESPSKENPDSKVRRGKP